MKQFAGTQQESDREDLKIVVHQAQVLVQNCVLQDKALATTLQKAVQHENAGEALGEDRSL